MSLINQYPGKLAVYDIALNRQKYGVDAKIVPHAPVKGEPTAEEMERRRPKGYKLTLDQFERDDDVGNFADMNKLSLSIVNNKLSIQMMDEDELKKLKKLKKHNKLRIKNHGDDLEILEQSFSMFDTAIFVRTEWLCMEKEAKGLDLNL